MTERNCRTKSQQSAGKGCMQPHLSCSDSTTPGSSSLDPPPLLNLNLQRSLEGLSWPVRNTPGSGWRGAGGMQNWPFSKSKTGIWWSHIYSFSSFETTWEWYFIGSLQGYQSQLSVYLLWPYLSPREKQEKWKNRRKSQTRYLSTYTSKF